MESESGHKGYYRILVRFSFGSIPKNALETLSSTYGARNFGRTEVDREYFFEFDHHPINFLSDIFSSDIAEECFIEGEPFGFDI